MSGDDKYLVFKREEFTKWLYTNTMHDSWSEHLEIAPRPLVDAVVLRLQDKFTAPALRAYRDQVLAVIEILESNGYSNVTLTKQLQAVADKFEDFATMAVEMSHKYPD